MVRGLVAASLLLAVVLWLYHRQNRPLDPFLAGADSSGRDCRFMALSSSRIQTTIIGEWIRLLIYP